MIINPAQIKSIAPYCHNPDSWAIALTSTMKTYQIDSRLRACAFIAQCCEESTELNVLEENLNYSSASLMRTWPKRFPTTFSTIQYMHNPMALANFIYANKNGNGNEASGDGWKYRGRGLFEVTGRGNYAMEAGWLQLPLLDHPELLTQPMVAADSAGAYWKSRGLNSMADQLFGGDGPIVEITRVINGGSLGIDQRRVYYHRALAAIAS